MILAGLALGRSHRHPIRNRLLFTFLAILVALLAVKITESQQITGLDLLIEGLSGKFVSSIAALLTCRPGGPSIWRMPDDIRARRETCLLPF